jgi:hypothetical protein
MIFYIKRSEKEEREREREREREADGRRIRRMRRELSIYSPRNFACRMHRPDVP